MQINGSNSSMVDSNTIYEMFEVLFQASSNSSMVDSNSPVRFVKVRRQQGSNSSMVDSNYRATHPDDRKWLVQIPLWSIVTQDSGQA